MGPVLDDLLFLVEIQHLCFLIINIVSWRNTQNVVFIPTEIHSQIVRNWTSAFELELMLFLKDIFKFFGFLMAMARSSKIDCNIII
jgi:hypothetical protein